MTLIGQDIWVDDVREAPPGWVWLKTSQDAIEYLRLHKSRIPMGVIDKLSLDHDLGPESEKDAIVIVDWIVENNYWPRHIFLHTANPVGRDNMLRTLLRNVPDGTELYRGAPVEYQKMIRKGNK